MIVISASVTKLGGEAHVLLLISVDVTVDRHRDQDNEAIN